ncbi:serine peptidase, S1 family [Staphylococcus aureus]|nr:serine peptidase, S1 family [Staphylococcus aureus]
MRINDLKLDYINYWIGKYRSHPYNKKVKVIKSKYIYWKNIEITKKGDNKLIKKIKRIQLNSITIFLMGINITLYTTKKIDGWVTLIAMILRK